jgi:hypothetical protein
MKSRHLIRVATVGAVCLGATAFSGLPWADANQSAATASTKSSTQCIKLDIDDQPVCGIMRVGATGARGARGPRGLTGATGATGPRGLTGLTGPRGPVGLTGATGATGPQGPQGLQGVQGAPGHTVVVAGTQIQETAPSGGTGIQDMTLPESVAQCPSSSTGTPEAYGGGVTIQKSGAKEQGDVISIQQHFPGTYNSSTQLVDQLPAAGSNPGTASTTAANAYGGQAVITQLNEGDTVTVQTYVICGP